MSRSRPPARATPTGELLAVAVTVTALVGSVRLFDGAGFLAPVIASALLAHVLVAAVRRLGGNVALGALISALGVVVLNCWIHYSHTMSFGLPTGRTLDAVGEDLAGAADLLSATQVPLAQHPGLTVSGAAVAWLLALVSDWAAFRDGVRGEALIPAAVLIGVVATFGTAGGMLTHATITVACAVAFALAHRTGLTAGPATEPGGLRRPLLPRGVTSGALAVGAGALVTVALMPSLSDGPLWDLLDESDPAPGGGRKVVLSPLVSVPGQLQRNPDLELFTVTSTDRTYWRLTALGDFNGDVWSLDEATKTAEGSLPTAQGTSGPTTEVTQEYRISALAAVWLPAAYQPVAFEATGAGFEAGFEPNSSTLLVGSSSDNSDGLEYTVRSAVPRFESGLLASLRNGDVPPGFLDLPSDLNPALAEAAAAATAGSAGPYEQALALQNWLRSGFEYDLSVAPGHSSERLETFLFEERRGYCEQFAGAFATLARTLGLPTRVAVGFTPGVALHSDAAGRTLYSVQGRHAHAWPEVYISGAGWVAFEPTPGRGAPGAESYTLVAESQDAPGDAPESPPVTPEPSGPPPSQSPAEPDVVAPSPDTNTGEAIGRYLAIAGYALGALALAGIGYVAVTAALRVAERRSARRWAAARPERAALVTWEEMLDLLRPRRIRPRSDETPLELALRATSRLEIPQEPWRRVALCVSAAAFGPGPLPAELRGHLEPAAAEATSDLAGSLTPVVRLRAVLDPRPWRLLGRRLQKALL